MPGLALSKLKARARNHVIEARPFSLAPSPSTVPRFRPPTFNPFGPRSLWARKWTRGTFPFYGYRAYGISLPRSRSHVYLRPAIIDHRCPQLSFRPAYLGWSVSPICGPQLRRRDTRVVGSMVHPIWNGVEG